MTSRNTSFTLALIGANLVVFVLDRVMASGLAAFTLIASLVALAVIHGRTVLRRPIVVVAVGLTALAVVELLDAGLLPAIKL